MHSIPHRSQPSQSGFTLIELSIVLVIIGLIVGGVLVGQDLIKAAEVRATVGQYEKYNSAVNTFRTKYNGLPGDLSVIQASAFGLCASAGCMAGTAGLGDGNGLIADSSGTAKQIGEPLAFWQELSVASLVDGSFGAALTSGGAPAAALTGSNVTGYIPGAKLGRGNIWAVGSTAGRNFFLLTGATAITTGGAATYAAALTPIESYNIDVKIDDGAPNTGIVQARGTATDETLFLEKNGGPDTGQVSKGNQQGSEASGDCQVYASTISTATNNTYSRVAVSGNSPGCILRLRFN